MEQYFSQALEFLAVEWPPLLGIIVFAVMAVKGFRMLARMRARYILVAKMVRPEEPEDPEDPCPVCDSGTLKPEGLFPGGSCVEQCDGCGNVRLWKIEDGKVPAPQDFTADEWKKRDHAKIRQRQIRGREWGDIGVSDRSGE